MSDLGTERGEIVVGFLAAYNKAKVLAVPKA